MFDTHNTKYQSSMMAVTKETEKTISPDKVVEMYDKIEEIVLDTLVRYEIKSNVLNAQVSTYTSHSLDEKVLVKFDINGTKYRFTRTVTPEMKPFTTDKFLSMVMGMYVEEVSKLLFLSKTDVIKREDL